MPFLLANWRILGLLAILLVAGASVGVSRLQLANCRADFAQTKANYDLLIERVRQQNAAVEALEQAGKEAAARAAQERARAAAAIRIANDKAGSLERALHAPGDAATCDAAVVVVRGDLAAR